jgi:hypothetical protein
VHAHSLTLTQTWKIQNMKSMSQSRIKNIQNKENMFSCIVRRNLLDLLTSIGSNMPLQVEWEYTPNLNK